jgi:DNA-binding transcriptional ArsR family regulator
MDNDDLSLGIANLAQLLADQSRMKILLVLMDNRAYTATELALCADIVPSTTSSHLQRLLKAGLITMVAQGKHRYFRLASTNVAELLESQLYFSTALTPSVLSKTPRNLRYARTCYQHLAGEIAVALAKDMIEAKWIESQSMDLTEYGHQTLLAKGMVLPAWGLYKKQTCACLDWSERQFHIGKQIGKHLLQYFIQEKYFTTVLDSRQLQLTAKGEDALLDGGFTK